ncbi:MULTISPECIES: hypothetical protein [Comamonadaceae]|jgi:hypothetical protein|uniref:Uncharacterized protein n=2 Tax=Comamonadaceae TaxID=80864 RepID=A0A1I2E4P9_9BURK|nr:MULTISPECIES: hypothetical protein [Comamonadaceae]OJX31468.1 MAG: hypothetical protein BGO74_05900 [Burkholderiales bacterium 68-12]GAO20909.1 hypothetical protein ALISP_0729 [Alicycliphilus sp. B1]MDR7092840.1 hypothetical protein [Hydrogenophaga laconesensis]NCU65581.1 hypothetical protein [Acidovorax sp. 210-6]POR09071.1 hypothetical protein BV908_17380 [Diaphorobacter sp. LR2014-1]
MSEESRNDGTIRLLFEMSRDDNPPLYDDLIRFGKGVKRVNRLRLLAHEGLRAVTLPAPAPAGEAIAGRPATEAPQAVAPAGFGSGAVTDLVFAEPLGE